MGADWRVIRDKIKGTKKLACARVKLQVWLTILENKLSWEGHTQRYKLS